MSADMKTYGLIGKNISYSFSKKYFTQKFTDLQLNECQYLNFDLQKIENFEAIFKNQKNIKGLNVTIPYKQTIIPFLDALSDEAKQIGAVNTIKITDGKLMGHNTDAYGFEKSLKSVCDNNGGLALILGTGGASKAVNYTLLKLGFEVIFVSRTPKNKQSIAYADITKEWVEKTKLIVNCSPLGTYPNTEIFPDIPYQYLNKNHILFDLVYNPLQTQFMLKGQTQGATTKNGYEMLASQAEKAWEIWNS